MGNLVVVGVCHLRTHFGTLEQFVTPLCNAFLKSIMFVALYGMAHWLK